MNRRVTSRPIGGEHLISGERARRAELIAAVYPIDAIDAFVIHEFMAGQTDTLGGGVWDRIETIGWVA
jgi:hypothetical protein